MFQKLANYWNYVLLNEITKYCNEFMQSDINHTLVCNALAPKAAGRAHRMIILINELTLGLHRNTIHDYPSKL